jgi:hypothetical protein
MPNKTPALCNTCKANGWPAEQIKFEQIGVKEDGKTPKFKPVNLDGSEHKHKEKAGGSQTQLKPQGDNQVNQGLFAQNEEIIRLLRSIDQQLTILNTKL